MKISDIQLLKNIKMRYKSFWNPVRRRLGLKNWNVKGCSAFMLIMAVSCTLLPDDFRHFIGGSDTGITRRAEPVSESSSGLVFETDLSFIIGNNNNLGIGYLEQSGFSFSGSGTYSILNFSDVQLNPPAKSSFLVLLDQSGSYQTADTENFRCKSLDKFFHDVMPPSDFLLGAFAKDGLLNAGDVEFYADHFSMDAETQVPYLFNLARRTSGKSVLLDALYQSMDKLAAATGDKNIIALVHGPDEASVITSDKVIVKAASNKVKINIVMLGKKEDSIELAKVSASTGGLFSLCPTTDEMITTFNHLYTILNDATHAYRIKVKFVPEGGSYTPGIATVHTLLVHDTLYDYDFSPMLVYIKVPN